MRILSRSNYLVFFDDVQVDAYLIDWNTNLGLFADNATAAVTLHNSTHLKGWKAYLTQVRIFIENPFTQKFCMVFEGEIINRTWSEARANSGKITYAIKGFYHWLTIDVPMGITHETEFSRVERFIYEAQNININAVREFMISRKDAMNLDKNIEELIETLYDKLTIGYYDVAGANTAFSFAKIKERFKVMVDVKEEFRKAGFLDLFTFANINNIQSFYAYLNNVLSQLMYEFYQDRDGSFRIKTPSWAENVLKAHIIDASLIESISGMDSWDREPTRILALGASSQLLQGNTNLNSTNFNSNFTLPIGLYVGNPRDPESETFYSQSIDYQMEVYGRVGEEGEIQKYFTEGEWFDNTSNYRITDEHGSKNKRRPDHQGIDLGYKNENIYSIGTNGSVKKIGNDGKKVGRGHYIQIAQTINGENYTFQYAHLSAAPTLAVGEKVAPGMKIGVSGNTGNSTGAHLHFEIWRGEAYTGVNLHPLDFLQSVTVHTKSEKEADSKIDEEKSASKPSSVMFDTVKDLTEYGVTDAPLSKAEDWQIYHISAYTAFCAGCTGTTSGDGSKGIKGKDVRDTSKDHRVVAVDKKEIPIGSIIEIDGLGFYTAYDTGGMIKGAKLDLLVRSNVAANAWGRRNMRARVIRRGPGNKTFIQSTTPGPDPHTLVEGSSAATYKDLKSNVSQPKDGVSSGSSMSSSVLTNRGDAFVSNKLIPRSFSSIDEPLTFSDSIRQKSVETSKKILGYPMKTFEYPVPSHAPTELKAYLKMNPSGIDGNLLASIISVTSNFRELYNANGQVGIAGINKRYADAVLSTYDLSDAKTNVKYAAEFFANALKRFNWKVTFALGAYFYGGMNELSAAVTSVGAMDFAALRKSKTSLSSNMFDFVDKVLDVYLGLTGSKAIKGDPHKEQTPATTTNTTLPDDLTNTYKANLSDEERQFKVNLMRVEQTLIRLDGSAGGSSALAEQLIHDFAKYTMILHRAQSHSMTIQMRTVLPFLRPGYNIWVEPTRTDVVAYITNIGHYGSFDQGCGSVITAGYVRDPSDYTEVDESVFTSKKRADSSVFGKTVKYEEMTDIRNKLKEMHKLDSSDMAHRFMYLRELYSSHTGTGEFATTWNKEYTKLEIIQKINALYAEAPAVVKTRKTQTKKVFEKAESFFLEKLLFTRKGV